MKCSYLKFACMFFTQNCHSTAQSHTKSNAPHKSRHCSLTTSCLAYSFGILTIKNICVSKALQDPNSVGSSCASISVAHNWSRFILWKFCNTLLKLRYWNVHASYALWAILVFCSYAPETAFPSFTSSSGFLTSKTTAPSRKCAAISSTGAILVGSVCIMIESLTTKSTIWILTLTLYVKYLWWEVGVVVCI